MLAQQHVQLGQRVDGPAVDCGHTVAFDQAGIPWEDHVVIDDAFKRPAEVDLLVGDYGKAEKQLGWKPETDFEQLIRLMVDADIALFAR